MSRWNAAARRGAIALVAGCAAVLAGCSDGGHWSASSAALPLCGDGVPLPCRIEGPQGRRVTYVDGNGERSTIAAADWEALPPVDPYHGLEEECGRSGCYAVPVY